MGHTGKREGLPRTDHAPPPRPSPNWTRGRGCAPSFLPFSLPLPCLLLLILARTPSWTRKGGILLPVGVGLLLGRTIERAGPPPPPLLYIRGGGHPLETQQLIIDLLAVCGVPSMITHLDHIVAVLRRSPASVASSTTSPRCSADEALPGSSTGS